MWVSLLSSVWIVHCARVALETAMCVWELPKVEWELPKFEWELPKWVSEFPKCVCVLLTTPERKREWFFLSKHRSDIFTTETSSAMAVLLITSLRACWISHPASLRFAFSSAPIGVMLYNFNCRSFKHFDRWGNFQISITTTTTTMTTMTTTTTTAHPGNIIWSGRSFMKIVDFRTSGQSYKPIMIVIMSSGNALRRELLQA